jgi:hypothetical protein
MTRVDQEPEPEPGNENIHSALEYLHTNLRDWEGSEAWKDIKFTLSSLNLNSRIAKVIGMACGAFTPTLESQGRRRSAVQHAFLLTLKELLQESNLGTAEVACYAQDPGYSQTDRLVLEKSDIKVLEDPEAFLEMDDASLVFSCAPNICVKEIVADIARPLVLIWCTVEEEDPENLQYVFSRPWWPWLVNVGNRTDPDSPRVREMIRTCYDQFPFPEDHGDNFSRMTIYVKRQCRVS